MREADVSPANHREKKLRHIELHIERPRRGMEYLQARSLLRWLSAHTGQKAWAIGTRKWSILLLKDETQETKLSAGEAIERVRAGSD